MVSIYFRNCLVNQINVFAEARQTSYCNDGCGGPKKEDSWVYVPKIPNLQIDFTDVQAVRFSSALAVAVLVIAT